MKLNTDVAMDSVKGSTGLGWVLRDDQGTFKAAMCIPCVGLFSPKEAEAMAIREALSWMKNHKIDFLQVETDALQIVQDLKSSNAISACALILLDVKEMMSDFSHISISFVKRSANMAAHLLARESILMSDRTVWVDNQPSFIVNALYVDLN